MVQCSECLETVEPKEHNNRGMFCPNCWHKFSDSELAETISVIKETMLDIEDWFTPDKSSEVVEDEPVAEDKSVKSWFTPDDEFIESEQKPIEEQSNVKSTGRPRKAKK